MGRQISTNLEKEFEKAAESCYDSVFTGSIFILKGIQPVVCLPLRKALSYRNINEKMIFGTLGTVSIFGTSPLQQNGTT